MTHRHTHRADETGDFSQRRHGMDPTMKKLVFGLIGVLLAVVGTFATWDRTNIKDDATFGKEGVIRLNVRVGAVEEDVNELKKGQIRIEKRVVEGQQKILETLYTLPSKRRQQEMPVLETPE